MVKQQIDNIHEHYYQKYVQDATYQRQFAELCEGEVVICMDYSENSKNKWQNEITLEPILESKGMHSIFQKKTKKWANKGKIFEKLAKNV